MRCPTIDDLIERLTAPTPSVIAESLAAAKAGIAVLHHHPDIAVQRGAADAMLLLLVARDALLPFTPDTPALQLQRLPDDTLRDAVVRLLRALSGALVSTELHPGDVDAMAAGRASLYLDDAADALTA